MQSMKEDFDVTGVRRGSASSGDAPAADAAVVRVASPAPSRPAASRSRAVERLRAPVALVLLGLASSSAFAQAPPGGGILRDVERSLPTRQVTSPEGVQIEVPDAAPLSGVGDDARLQVRSYRVTGQTVFDEATLLEVIDHRTGTLSLAELRQVADELTRFYRERGYLLARAYLPEQQIEQGVVTIAVLEGRYDEIEIDSGARLSEKRVRRTLSKPLCEEEDCAGALIDRRPLERGLLLLNDTPGARAAAQLSPGTFTGSSTLTGRTEADRLASGYMQLDNNGSYYTGLARLMGALWINSPAGIGDQLTLQAVAAGHHGEMYYGMLGYGLPLGYSGARLSIRGSNLRYELGEQYEALEAEGTVRGGDVALFYPFVRSLRGNFYGSFSYGERRFHDQAEAVALSTRREIAARRELSVNGDFLDELFGVGATNTASLVYSTGELELDAGLSLVDALTTRSAGEYDKWMASYSRLQPLFGRSSLYLRTELQFTSDNLDSYEKFALGGPTSVRAYPASDTLVDEAVLNSVEWRQRFGRNSAQIWEGVLFYDRAHGNFNAAPWDGTAVNHVTLEGVGIGLNVMFSERIALRSTVAFRGDRPMTAAPDDDYHYYLSWNVGF